MAKQIALNTSIVATSIRPLSTTSTALRRFSAPPQFHTSTRNSQRLFSTAKSNRFVNTTSKMVVHTIQGKGAFTEKLESSNGLVVIDCFATWCGPCKAIAPKLVEYSNQPEFSNVEFIKIDVDESPDVAQELGVRAMPTFMFMKDGQKVDELVGADPKQLKALIEKHK